jgi:hypothetical protein
VGDPPKDCPIELLKLDLDNPRLQTGIDLDIQNDSDLIAVLSEIAALDELVTSICTNTYLNLEPLIVTGTSDRGPFTVLEGNRRLAAIKLIQNPAMAQHLGITIPQPIRPEVLKSMKNLLAFRVAKREDARAFIGFKHINGPQRWDAYAKARYVTDWYKKAKRTVGIDSIAAMMGDNNNTLRAYIYSVLMLEQAEEEELWSIKDRANNGRFAFSHLYTAIGRKEYQQFLGLTEGWVDKPPLKPIKNKFVPKLGETLTYIYGAKSDDRPALVRSQNPDLKFLGEALVNTRARQILRNRGTLDDALDELKDPSDAFQDSLIAVNLRLKRAISLMPKYQGGKQQIDNLIEEIFEQADTLKIINNKKQKIESASRMALSVPPLKASTATVADWVEIAALASPRGTYALPRLKRIWDTNRGFEDTDPEGQSKREEDTDEQGVGGRDDDAFLDSINDELAERSQALGTTYPFRISDGGQSLVLEDTLDAGQSIYLFCLLLTHCNKGDILDGTWKPLINHRVRDLFQACSTIAAAGEVNGCAMSFGWPRPGKNPAFLKKLHSVYKLFGEGKPVKRPRRGAAIMVKDEEIDVIAWKPRVDRVAGTYYLLGQVASGDNWQCKSIKGGSIDYFHRTWFTLPPASPGIASIFIPHAVPPGEGSRRDRMDLLTEKYGIILYRLRIPFLAMRGLEFAAQNTDWLIERVEDIEGIKTWVAEQIAALRIAAIND